MREFPLYQITGHFIQPRRKIPVDFEGEFRIMGQNRVFGFITDRYGDSFIHGHISFPAGMLSFLKDYTPPRGRLPIHYILTHVDVSEWAGKYKLPGERARSGNVSAVITPAPDDLQTVLRGFETSWVDVYNDPRIGTVQLRVFGII